MDIQKAWEKALKTTEIIRPRVQPLHTDEVTRLPYVFLGESAINPGDTVVRRGEVLVERPSIILPYNMPQFEGFEFEEGMRVNEEFLKSFFLVRGISFPSMKYNNRTASVEVREGRLSDAVRHFSTELQRAEDVATGLLTGKEDCWQFAVLIFTCGQAARSVENDLRKLLDPRRGFGLS